MKLKKAAVQDLGRAEAAMLAEALDARVEADQEVVAAVLPNKGR